jgi:hypothetical protein
LWGGAPGKFEARAAWDRASSLSATQWAFLLALALFLSLLVAASPVGSAAEVALFGRRIGIGLHRRKLRRLRERLNSIMAEMEATDAAGTGIAQERVDSAGKLDLWLREHYPAGSEEIKATAIGNIFTASSMRIQEERGLDLNVAWPRLYPVISEPMRSLVDSRRDQLDALQRLNLVMLLLVPVSTALLVQSGWWLLVPVALLALSRIAARGASTAALRLAESMRIAVEQGQLALLDAYGKPAPSGLADLRNKSEELSHSWLQGEE